MNKKQFKQQKSHDQMSTEAQAEHKNSYLNTTQQVVLSAQTLWEARLRTHFTLLKTVVEEEGRKAEELWAAFGPRACARQRGPARPGPPRPARRVWPGWPAPARPG